VDEWRLNIAESELIPGAKLHDFEKPFPLSLRNAQRAVVHGCVLEKSHPIGVKNLRQTIFGDDIHRGATTDSGVYRYHGQRTAIHHQMMFFQVCLEWF
jgi:hypothetical protein